MNQSKTKIELVISQIEQQIKNRSLTPGSRLPSVRKLSKDLGFLFLLLLKLMNG
ncbi:GntR family transcriptional regulator [Acinetobacter seifertii]|nr:GntR family transcriptional regulator [Acinetobacter seifertii]